MAIGALFGKIFGTEKALGSIVDGVSNGLDALVYTDEEKASDAAKDRSEARKMVIQWMETSKGQNIARRVIALMVTGVWLFQFVIAWLMNLWSVFVNNEISIKLADAAKVTSDSAETMIGAVMLILGFYFAAPHMGSLAKAAVQKFGSAQTKQGNKPG
tara:strand:+ start:211 stop:684 length:474 start_codon:yes stop_codon:yes gene_type:complete